MFNSVFFNKKKFTKKGIIHISELTEIPHQHINDIVVKIAKTGDSIADVSKIIYKK